MSASNTGDAYVSASFQNSYQVGRAESNLVRSSSSEKVLFPVIFMLFNKAYSPSFT